MEKVMKNWFFQLLARSWFWMLFYSIQILFKKYCKIDFSSFWQDLGLECCFFLFKFYSKKYWNIDFSSFWQDLGFGCCFFYSNSIQKSIETLIFLAFGKILVLDGVFSFQIQILIKKVLKIWFCHLLARSWFWMLLLCVYAENVIFMVFETTEKHGSAKPCFWQPSHGLMGK